MSQQSQPESNGESETDSIVTAEALDRGFGDVDVITDVSVRIDHGTVACLVGPNGSGKSTLLQLVAGLLDPDSGSITVTDTGDRPVGYLAQQPAFRPQFTVRETLSFYATLVEADVDVPAVIDRVGLSSVADRRVDALSGGMMRLLGIAQTTIGDPSLLVLDEPSSGLDPMMTRHITDIIDDLGESGDAILLATHDLRSVQRIADTVLVLDRGELVADAPPETLLDETDTDTLEDALGELTAADAIGVSAGYQGGEQS